MKLQEYEEQCSCHICGSENMVKQKYGRGIWSKWSECMDCGHYYQSYELGFYETGYDSDLIEDATEVESGFHNLDVINELRYGYGLESLDELKPSITRDKYAQV